MPSPHNMSLTMYKAGYTDSLTIDEKQGEESYTFSPKKPGNNSRNIDLTALRSTNNFNAATPSTNNIKIENNLLASTGGSY